uniref:Uncharacterized protein n=1 Tax=Rhizophora mucronata TaxID=61149 RepID=A0A2P2PUY1_RHIMU
MIGVYVLRELGVSVF